MRNSTFAWLLIGILGIMAVFAGIGLALAVPVAGIALGIVVSIVFLAIVPIRRENGDYETIISSGIILGGLGKVLTLIAVVATLFLLFAFCTSRNYILELQKSKEYMVQEWTNDRRKQNMQSEVESGIFGTLNANAPIYDRFGKVHTDSDGKAIVLSCGRRVMSFDLKGIPANQVHQGFTRVITTNRYGDFVQNSENVFYVVSSKIDWD